MQKILSFAAYHFRTENGLFVETGYTNSANHEKEHFCICATYFCGPVSPWPGSSKNRTDDQNQVPITIRLAFETKFGQIPEGGYWTG